MEVEEKDTQVRERNAQLQRQEAELQEKDLQLSRQQRELQTLRVSDCLLAGVRAQIWDQKFRSSWQAEFEAFFSLRLTDWRVTPLHLRSHSGGLV